MRPNGTVGPHYPLTSSIDSDQAESLIDYLDGRPKADRSKSRRKAAPKAQPAKPVAAESSELSDKVAQLQSDFSTLIDLLPQIIKEAGQTAKPSEGHTKVEAAEPPQVEVTGPVYRAGDVIWVELSDGTVAQRQLSSDAKRLNVTIV